MQDNMNRFAIGMLVGGAMMATGFLLRDEKQCHSLACKGKKMARRAGAVMDDMMDRVEEMM